MGDQVGQAVEGTLYYVPYGEFERVRACEGDRAWRAATFADMCRLNTLYMIARAGSGHIGSSFSSLDIVSWLLLEELSLGSPAEGGDVYFSSKGHDAPGYYAALIGMGRLSFDLLHKLRRRGGLPGHPDVATPGIVANTGSLGMGVSKAKGMVLANRLARRSGRIFVMTGDGELQEGQFWESLVSAANRRCHEITVIVDHNKLQSDTFVQAVSDLGDLEAKFRAFGWRVARCDGHDPAALSRVMADFRNDASGPKALIADTIKGRGVSFMEHTSLDSDVAMYRFHSGAPDSDAYRRAAQELIDRIDARLMDKKLSKLTLETARRDPAPRPPTSPQRLVVAYSRALIEAAERRSDIVALDADLVLDTGLIPFRERFPDRFIECGIAEQDMVSVAGGLALAGFLPVVHSFACFLSARPNEQIYNNATERKRIVYVGSLAGVVPGGPGHSHQAVRDVALMASIPGLTVMEPSTEREAELLFHYALEQKEGSYYLRLVSLPWAVPFSLPPGYTPERGKGVSIFEGQGTGIFAYGPVLLSVACEAAQKLRNEHGISVKVFNLPWLNYIDETWFEDAIRDVERIFALDNHYAIGGQGDRIADLLSRSSRGAVLHRVAVEGIPSCGSNQEVLDDCGLGAEALVSRILQVND